MTTTISKTTESHLCEYLVSAFRHLGLKEYKRLKGLEFPESSKCVSNRKTYLQKMRDENYNKFVVYCESNGVSVPSSYRSNTDSDTESDSDSECDCKSIEMAEASPEEQPQKQPKKTTKAANLSTMTTKEQNEYGKKIPFAVSTGPAHPSIQISCDSKLEMMGIP